MKFFGRSLLALLLSATPPAFAGVKEIPPPSGFKADPYGEVGGRTFAVVPGKNSPWSFTIEPYGWLPGLEGDVGIRGFPASHIDYSPKTLLSNLRWGAFLKGEARYGRWGILGDGLFVDLQADASSDGPLYKSATVGVQQGLAQLALAYRVWEDYRGFVDLYVGARYNYYGVSVSAAQDSAGIQQVGEDSSQRISERLGAATDKLVTTAASSLATRLDSEVQAAKTAGAEQLAALQKQVQRAIRQGKTASVDRLQALQSQVTHSLQAKVDGGLAQVDAIRTQVSEDVRRTVGASVVRRWADTPRDVRRFEDRRTLDKVLNPVRREFTDLVTARVQQQVAFARVQVAQALQNQVVALAKQRVAAAERVLANTLTQHAKSDRAAAHQLVATSRAQLAAAQARAGEISRSVNPDALKSRVSKAEKKLARAISKKLEDTLPTEGSSDRWWVDPIVGVRAQVNLTRWLYLATQCDAGGFGAGSQIAWNLNGTVGVNWSRNFFTEIGYRYYYVDYNHAGLLYQVAESGIFLGGGVKF